MPVNIDKKTIKQLLKDQEMIEYQVIELRTNEFLVNIEILGRKNISVITNNWKELFGVIS
jgi:hypothetical protein